MTEPLRLTVRQLREQLDKLPDSAQVLVEVFTGEPLALTCDVIDAFPVGTKTNDPGLVLKARPVPR